MDDAPLFPSPPLRDRLFWRTFSHLAVFTILFEDTDLEDELFGVDGGSSILADAFQRLEPAASVCTRRERSRLYPRVDLYQVAR